MRLPPQFNERYFASKFDIGKINLPKKNPGDVWDITTEGFKEAHFSVFPKKLVARCIACACPPDGVVLDPFMGSGTTAVVCELFNTKQFDR